jgi:hypothetical protein
MAKKLKIWNGRGHGKFTDSHIYVCATSQKHAAELISNATSAYVTSNEISKYYSNCWGNSMDGIEPEVGVWVSERNGKNVRKIL